MLKKSSPMNKGSVFFGSERMAIFCLVFLSVLFAYPDNVLADTFGLLLCNARLTGSGYSHILNAGAFTIGLFLLVRGVLLARRHAESPGNQPSIPAIAHMVGGGILMSLPAAVGVIQRTVFSSGGGAGTFGCTPGPVVTASSLDVMMQNFVRNIYGPMFSLLSVLSVIIGLTLIVRALMRGAKSGAGGQDADPKKIISYLVIGAVLISMGTVLPDVLRSLFGASSTVSNVSSFNGIQWSNFVGTGVDTTAATNTVRAILAFIQIVGGIAFLRGWLIMKAALEGGQGTMVQGITHIVGGAMAINIDIMIDILDNTFGTGLIS